MKYLLLILVTLLCLPLMVIGQDINSIVNRTSDNDDYSTAVFLGKKNSIPAHKFNKWIKNTRDYTYLDKVEEETWKWGCSKKVVTQFVVVKAKNITAYNAYQEDQKEKREEAAKRREAWEWAAVGLAGYGAVKLVQGIGKGIKTAIANGISNMSSGNTYAPTETKKEATADKDGSPQEHTVPNVKQREFQSNTYNVVYGDVQRWYMKFEDGVSGYAWYSPKYNLWYIHDGLAYYWEYVDKEAVTKALYMYKKYSEISKDGKK